MTGQPTPEQKISPMMLQWHACKKQAEDALLLFRMGDFYEAFYEDAATISKALDLTLTKRQEILMCGVPYHTCDTYIDRLVSKGFRIAIAEQMEDPKQAKGLVRRELVRIISPGTLINSSLLSEKSNNYIAAITQVGSQFGLAYLDTSTGEFYSVEFNNEQELLSEIYRIKPAEITPSKRFCEKQRELLRELQNLYALALTPLEDWRFEHQACVDFLLGHFKLQSLDGFGLRGMTAATNAAGALLAYIKDVLCLNIEHIEAIQPYSTQGFMVLDRMTQKNLELTESLQDGSRKNTLLAVLDRTKTPMGARLLRKWLKQPLLDSSAIIERQDAIQELLTNEWQREKISGLLETVRDVERLITKVCTNYATPRDLTALKSSFESLPELHSLLAHCRSPLLHRFHIGITPLPELTQLIANAIVDEPPVKIHEGGFIKTGFHAELDELRALGNDSKTWLANYQNQLREETKIKTLKVGYNRMFGYFIEVSKGQADKMPDSFQRRQTLVNGERFITPELKEYESKVLTAEERSIAIEAELFAAIKKEIANYSRAVCAIARQIASLDAILSLSLAAYENHYCRPVVDASFELHIEEGRHPVIELNNIQEKFIGNDTYLNNTNEKMLIITGPNMAGKSTYIRQVALIAIMAQMGSYVPARKAHIGLIDKVFTRIGASDDLSRGQSTFMVEMSEAANILNNATERSLVILDEIGRGTSTYDGISIAWSIAEYLLTAENKQAKTLFATHYWELTKLEGKIEGAVNYNVAVGEYGDQIVFLRKIIRGGTDKSYGIHVARLAGMPQWVVSRAGEILRHLEENANRKSAFEPEKPRKVPAAKNKPHPMQLSLFEVSY